MNCKPGDLAIVVRSSCGNEGRIVRCVRWVGGLPDFVNGDLWEVDVMLNTKRVRSGREGKANYVPDSYLRPIRDPGDDAVDETLLRLPSPRQEVTA